MNGQQNSRDEMNDIVAHLENNEEMRYEIGCAIQNKMKIQITDERNEELKEPNYYR